MRKKYGQSLKLGYGSDFETVDINNTPVLLEYENSSRGVSMNYLRVFRKMKGFKNVKIKLVFVRTDLHIKNHKNDLDNMICAHETIKKEFEYFDVFIYSSVFFIENIDLILSKLNVQSPDCKTTEAL